MQSISLFDLNGRKITSSEHGQFKTFQLPKIAKGTYIVVGKSLSGKPVQRKIVLTN